MVLMLLRKRCMNSTNKKIGLFIGRFQPFHRGHLDALKQILEANDLVKIFIGSSNIQRTKDNPLSYEERKRYIKNVLPFSNYTLSALPDDLSDDVWAENLKNIAEPFDTAYIMSSDHTEKVMKNYDIPVKKLQCNIDINATALREMIRNKDEDFKKYIVDSLFPDTLRTIIETT